MLVGIDWAKNFHQVIFCSTTGKIIAGLKIKNTYQGYLELLEKFRASKEEVVFAIENRNLRLVDFLIAHGFKGFYVDPNAMKGYRARYKSAPVKSDELDAYILADLLRTDQHNLKTIVLDNPLVRELKGLLMDRARLVKDEVRLTNRLKSCLVEYYPEALQFFKDPSGKVALDFWSAYPTLEDVRRLTVKDIAGFLAKRNWHRDKAEVAQRIVEIVNGPVIKVLTDVVRVKSRLLLGVVRQLKSLQETIEEYDKEIKCLVESNEEAARYTSLPGSGSVIGGALYTLFHGGLGFNNPTDIRAYVGTAPVTNQSGQFKGVSFRFACNKFYRNIIQQLAFCSLRGSQWARERYRQKRREGKKHNHALRCLGDLWIKVIFAMRRNKESYDEQKHLASVARFWLNNEGLT
jgi:transposase